jgi:hypothetical protein
MCHARRVLYSLALACVVAAYCAGQAWSGWKPGPNRRLSPMVFGYQLGHKTKRSSPADIQRRFGRTCTSEMFAHSLALVYRTSDGKAYLVFGWADAGLETVLVTRSFEKAYSPPKNARIRKISVSSTRVTANGGIRLGDREPAVRRALGRPDWVNRRRSGGYPRGHCVSWIYVADWVTDPDTAGKNPGDFLEVTFQQGRVVALSAEEGGE